MDDHGAQGAYLRGLLTAGMGAKLEDVSRLGLLLETKAPGNDGWSPLPTNDAMVGEGMGALVSGLGAQVRPALEEPVRAVSQTADGIQVRTDKRTIHAAAAIVTVPLALLKAGAIELDPSLSARQVAALSRVGVSKEMKTFLMYAEISWPASHHVVGLPDSPYFDFFVDLAAIKASPAIVALSAGEKMERALGETADHLAQALSDEVRKVFGDAIAEPTSSFVSDFSTDPYALGCWSYGNVESVGNEQSILCEPIGGRILLAGEGTSHRYGFVDGAWHDGQRAAQLLIEAASR